MTLKIISSQQIMFEGDVDVVTLPGAQGQFTVLPHHASIVSTLTTGKLRYRTVDGEEHNNEISGGIADVDNNIISVCVY